jgi:hypothetical protein
MNIPDIKELYPIKNERYRKYQYVKKLLIIYNNLIQKMNKMTFITRIPKIKKEELTIEN